ncbi:MAG: hypothetical protein A2X12_05905 [Bacteroidetes bacterium GWE2_29_8]|nr:MAG: hypothetical protein A2X12_05905 [Bacteroidetes bacterium GWE2_29_8]OFY18751.1 MAG: hypothetical protein A2X02_04370 [Bacteroidetes bacterium GWF2_29_10]
MNKVYLKLDVSIKKNIMTFINNFKNKYLSIFIIILAISLNVIAQEEDADAVFLKQIREYQLNEDGSLDFHYQHQLKYLTYYSFNSKYGETFIVYNPQYQKLKINNSMTTMANGKKVIAPQNSFNEVLPRFASEVPAYNNLREMVVTHTGLERNCIVDLDYTLKTDKDFFPALMGSDVLSESSPIKELIYIIKIPKGKTFNYATLNINVKPEITQTDKQTTYKWVFKNISPHIYEVYQQNQQEYLPRLLYNTAKDYRELFNTFITQEAFNAEINQDIKSLVDSLIKNETNELKQALKLQNYVVNEIRYYHVPLYCSGFKLRNIEEVYKSNGGNELEKAILLNAMLNYSGINSEIVAVFASEFIQTEAVNLMNGGLHLIKINPKDRSTTMFLSSVQLHNQNYKYQISGKTIIPLKKDNVSVAIGRENSLSNISSLKGTLNITKDNKLKGNIKIDITKGLNPYLAILKDSTELGKLLNCYLDDIEIKNIKVATKESEKTSVEYIITDKTLKAYKSGNFSIFELPQIKNGADSYGIKILSSNRISPIELPLGFKEEYDWELTLSEGRTFVNQNINIEEEGKAGSVFIEIKQNGDKIKVKRQIKLSQDIIKPEFYNDFKKIMDIWNNSNYRQLIIKGE